MVGSRMLFRDSSLPLLLRMTGAPNAWSCRVNGRGRTKSPQLVVRNRGASDDSLWILFVALRAQSSRLCRREGHRDRPAVDRLSQPYSRISGGKPLQEDAGAARW